MEHENLLSQIDAFLAETGLSAYRFGWLAAKNGRLVDRIREGRPILNETERKVRAFIAGGYAKRGRAAQ